MAFAATYNAAAFNGTAVVPATPSGVVNGNLLVVHISQSLNSITVASVPTGWTLLQGPSDSVGGDARAWLYYKLANNEPATWTDTWTLSATVTGNVQSVRISGQDSASPIVTSLAANPPLALTHPITINSTVADAGVFIFVGMDQTTGDVSADAFQFPAGFTELGEAPVAAGGEFAGAGWIVEATAASRTYNVGSDPALLADELVMFGLVVRLGSTVTLTATRPASDVAAGGWGVAPLWSKVSDQSDATVISGTAV